MLKKQRTIGFSPFGEPSDGIGPFRHLFPKGVNLRYEKDLTNVDAVLLWGGMDITPSLYAESPLTSRSCGPLEPSSRDVFELELCKQAHKAGKPIIGVCRGAQFICAFAGGSLIQHTTGHGSDHSIQTYDDKKFFVTSSHHQMLYPWDVSHEMLAWSGERRSNTYLGNQGGGDYQHSLDRVVVEPEVVFFPDVNGFAIQSHPEWEHEKNPFLSWMFEQMEEHLLGVFA